MQLLDRSPACILANCTALEVLNAKNITAIGCDQPIRDTNGAFRVTSNTLAVITGVFILARFLYRIFIAHNFGADDWVALAAFVVGIPNSVINIQGLSVNGLGRDVWTLQTAKIYRFIRFFYIAEILYFAIVALLKLTLLFFYLRIFPTQGVRRVIWATIGLVTVYGLTFVLVGIFQCQPISYYWTNWDGDHRGHCLNIKTIAWTNAAIGIALDLWMLAIPLWQLRKLRLHWKKKLGVSFMFIVGTFVTVVSILRLHSLLSLNNSTNATWDNYEIINWSTIEVNVGTMCACLPSVRLILVHFFPRVLGSSSPQYYNYYSSGGGPNGSSQANQNGNRAGADGNLSIGASGSRARRSVPLMPTPSNRHQKGTNTTITAINLRDEDDLGMIHHIRTTGASGGGVQFGRSNSGAGSHDISIVGRTTPAQHTHESMDGVNEGGGILFSKLYTVEYGSDYHDEARLMYKRGQAGNGSKSDLKSLNGSETSLSP
ncbi:hypothetical protein SEUCBS140593_010760 [Sporothrix eucalyptigena]|uniref:Rhodopsin domain-containing protein n=1 Tax=Sporothrix eucalyptigena TaxID=1812306 RepID=A0ABP0D270_9PEZI